MAVTRPVMVRPFACCTRVLHNSHRGTGLLGLLCLLCLLRLLRLLRLPRLLRLLHSPRVVLAGND